MRSWLPLAIAGGALLLLLLLSRPEGASSAPPDHVPADAGTDARTPAAASAPAPPDLLRAAADAGPGVPDEGAAGRLRLRILHEDGLPAVGARVATLDLLAVPPAVHGQWSTDEDGCVDLGPWSEAIGATRPFVIACVQHVPVLRYAHRATGLEEVRLEQELALRGRVQVDGAPPGVVLPLQVSGFRDPAAALPPVAREVLATWGLGDGTAFAWVTPAGSLELRGFPAGEVLDLSFPDEYVLASDPGATPPVHVRAPLPTLDLQVDLLRLPALHGQLIRHVDAPRIESADHFPSFPSMLLHLEWTLVAGGVRQEGATGVGSGQTFRVPIPRLPLDRAELRVRDADGLLLGLRALEGPITGSMDLGTWIVPEAERAVELTVLGESGAPVADALVVAHRAVYGRTGRDGRLRLTMRVPPGTLTIGAFGFRLQRVALPDPPPQEWIVRLEPASRLRLEVLQPDGSPAPQVVAVLSYGEDLPSDAPEAVRGFEEVRGPPSSGATLSDQWHEHLYPLAEGRGEWSDLPIGADFTLEVWDLYDHSLDRQTLRLGAAESRSVQVRLPRAGRMLSGRVLAPDGAPLLNAAVSLGGLFQEVRSDASGRFSLGPDYGESTELLLSAEGYVTRWIRGEEVADDRDWVLEPARTVWIEARDASGVRTRTGSAPLLTVDGGWQAVSQERGTGLYEVRGVPLRPGVVTVPDTATSPVRIGPEQTEVLIAVKE